MSDLGNLKMMKRLGFLAGLCVSMSLMGIEKSDLENASTKRSYALGANYGKLLSSQSIEIELDSFMSGLEDTLLQQSLLSDDEIKVAIQLLTEEFRARAIRQRQEAMAQNKAKGEAFLAENADKEGVITLESGLQYKVLEMGEGAIPVISDTVQVHYRGSLIDGIVFDSSYDREPAKFGVSGVIKGWTEALQLMPVGSKWQLFIPSQLAYGERRMAKIPSNSTLIFDVELLAITTPPVPESVAKPKPLTSDILRIPSAKEIQEGVQPEVIKADEVDDYKKKEQKAAEKALEKVLDE